jgi:putative hydrolase of the HAD superfamily
VRFVVHPGSFSRRFSDFGIASDSDIRASELVARPMLRALVFDLDDTLYPEHEFVLSGFRAVDAWLRLHRGWSGFQESATDAFASGARGNIFDLALRELGFPANSQLVSEMVRTYREHRPSLTLHPDARRALNHFRGSLKLGIITDGYLQTQQNKVAALGLDREFDTVICSDQWGREHWKPSPFPYQKLMEALACTGNECLYVGDNPAKDFVTARQLGWRTIQICRPGGEYSAVPVPAGHAADHQIRSLDELRLLPMLAA